MTQNTLIEEAISPDNGDILDVLPVPIQIIGSDGKYLYCNRETLHFFNLTSLDQIIGQNPASLSLSNQPDGRVSQIEMAKHIQAVISGEQQQFLWTYNRSDGKSIYTDASGQVETGN
jgi:PAS domain-containing protein